MSASPTRVLIVDDDAVDRRVCRRALLASGEAYDLAEAETGAAALQQLRSTSFDCVLLDYQLPDFDGLELLTRLADGDGLVQQPVVMLTGAEDVAVAVQAMRAGARDYLVKDVQGRYQDLIAPIVQRVRRDQEAWRGRRRAEQELRAAEARYRSLVEQLPAISYTLLVDEPPRLLFVSPQIAQLGRPPEYWQADPAVFESHVHPDDRAAAEAAWQRMLAGGGGYDQQFRFRTPDGRELWLRDQAQRVRDQPGEHPLVQGIVIDVTESHRAQQELEAHRHRLEQLVEERTAELRTVNQQLQQDIQRRREVERSLFREKQRAEITLEAIGDAVVTTDADGRVDYFNPAAERLTGWAAGEARAQGLCQLLSLEPVEDDGEAMDLVACLKAGRGVRGQYRLRPRQGPARDLAVYCAPLKDPAGAVAGAVVVFRDVTQERELARQMSYRASHDPLTGLVNRAEFEHRLARTLAAVRERGGEHALCFIDLDGFKAVNDNGGHAAGDELLRQLAQLMHGRIRGRDTLARLGGDEFACLFEHCDLELAAGLAEDLLETVRNHVLIWQGRRYQVGASIGLAALNAQVENAAELLRSADAACYAAKAAGRGRIEVYRQGQIVPVQPGQDPWRERIRQALEDGHSLALFLQPIAGLDGGEPAQFEVLLRLDRDGEWIPAASFMPSAERNRPSASLDRWVIGETIRRLEHRDGGVYFINVSEAGLADEALLEFIRDQLQAHPAVAGRVGFEINEAVALHRFQQAARFARAVKALGCRLALDDFANALPMMQSLRELQIDLLKIRADLIRGARSDDVARLLVETINRVSHALDIRTVAKWPETEQDLRTLAELGVDHVQGFLVRPPFPLGG